MNLLSPAPKIMPRRSACHDRCRAFTLIEMVVMLFIIATLSVITAYTLSSWRMSNRDARRVTDIGEIQMALEEHYALYKYYPTAITSGMKFVATSTVFMAPVPSNPQPSTDGNCTSTTEYYYYPQNDNQSYYITFCLGSRVGSWGAGNNQAFPNGQTTCIPDCVMSCNTGGNTGSDGCGGTCSNAAACSSGYTCISNHCIKNN